MSRRIVPAMLILFSVMMGIVAYWGVTTQDDLFFSIYYRDFIIDGAPFPGFEPWFRYLDYAWHFANGRIGDKFMPLVMTLPRGVFAALFGLSVWFLFSAGSRLSFGRGALRDPRSLVAASAFILFLPWNDYGLERCAFVNYIVGMALVANWLWLFLQPEKKGRWRLVGLVTLSVVTGFWHEEFSISLVIVAATLFFAESGRLKNRQSLWMAAGLCVGTAVIFTSPGFYYRATYESFVDVGYAYHHVLTGGVVSLGGAFLIALLLLSGSLRRKISSKVAKPGIYIAGYLCLLLFTVATAFAFGQHARRIWWFSDFITVVILLRLLSLIVTKRAAMVSVAVLCSVAMMSLLVGSVIVQRRIYSEHQKVLSQYIESDGGETYVDSLLRGIGILNSPLIFQYDLYTTMYGHPYGDFYLKRPAKLIVLPEELRDLDKRQLRALEGGFYVTPKGDFLVETSGPDKRIAKYLFYKDSRGKIHDRLVMLVPMEGDDRRRLYYIWPVFRPWRIDAEIAMPISME